MKQFYTDTWEYEDAKAECESKGARLAVMATRDDEQAISLLHAKKASGYFWVGLTKVSLKNKSLK